MSTPILATKLFIPPLRPKLVSRPHLIERLNEGVRGKLTLISAPAGFGKSTLVGEWLASGERRAAWLSLDEGDSDLTRFLAYMIAALQTLAAQLGEGVLTALHSAQPPATEASLTALLNEIAALPDEFVLVLDDYHAVDAAPRGAVDQALSFLLEHLPPRMHLVITTREDPSLPLARLRARGQLTELRAADLRFTAAEAAGFLHQVMGLNLSAAEIDALETRTEGWIAGLQLAALSMRGRADAGEFVKTFAGDNRYVVDYLVEEVLQRQPKPVRDFLLQTSILERLCGPLCDAVTGQAEGQARLEALERGNFFVAPLDDNRHWYRYHHLFADVLSAHLRAEQPDQVPILHRRASEWYEQSDLRADAIRHALAGEDYERAATLIELAVPEMRRSRQEATLLSWLKALPDDVLHFRPVLNVHYAGVLLQNGETEGVEAHLRDAEQWLETMAKRTDSDPSTTLTGGTAVPSGTEAVVMDPEDLRRLPGWIANYRAGYALVQGNVADTVTYAGRALGLLPEDDHLGHGAAAALLGLAYWAKGDLEAAHRTYAEGMARVQKAGHISDAIGGVIALADIEVAQGHLRQAMRTYERGLQLAAEQQPAVTRPVLRGTADMYVGMSELHRERNELTTATQYLLKSKEMGEHTGFPQYPYRWRVAMARIREAEGDLDGALDLLHEAERLYVSDFYPNVRPVSALKTRVWVAQGRLSEALNWAHEQGLSIHDDLTYLREFEHITLARVLLARYQHDHLDHALLEAVGLLERLLEAAEAGAQGAPRMGRVIEILLLQALAHQLQDDLPAALVPLQRALTLAEPEGYVRIFVDAGEAMRLLIVASRSWIAEQLGSAQNKKLTLYADKLLVGFGHQPAKVDNALADESPKIQNLVEPLSERELDVLRLLRTDLSGPEMARQLIVSLNTLHTHTKNIYSKLGVNNRRAAVRRAEELDLF
ncbi:MAG: AAA family ATPase [Caldilineaceae bacterium]|nr:AAA family ATPase [Caldilineaceae bacterium]